MKNILYIAIFTTAVVISWLIFGLYHNSTASTIAPDTRIIITPIPPKFDSDVISKIKTRQVVNADLSTDKKAASSTPTITQKPTPTIQPTKQPTSTPSAGI